MEQGARTLNVLLNVEPSFLPKARWAMETLCNLVGARARFHERFASDRVQIYYGPRTDAPYPVRIRHNPDAAAFFAGHEDYPDSKLRFQQTGDVLLPFLFSPPGDVFHVHGKQILIYKDIVSSVFYFLSCWQEHVGKPDKDGRYRYEDTLQARWNLAHVPVVDRYAALLKQAISIALPQLLLEPRWPGDAKSAVSLSHDLDYWNYWTRDELATMNSYNLKRLFRAPVRSLYKLLGHNLDKALFYHPARRNSSIVQREQRMGLHSTTFIISSPEMEDPRQNYLAMQGPELKDFLTIINDRMVQLHGAGEASFDLEELRRQMANLQQQGYRCRGYRAHHLRFDYDKTLALLEELGFAYDSSLGWWEHTGYRAGTGAPFAPFCHKQNRPYRLLELPMTVMDVTLWAPAAMHMSPERAGQMLRRIIKWLGATDGHMNLLWHYRTFDPVDYPKWRRLYWSLLDDARREGAWLCSLDELYDYWIKKHTNRSEE